MKKEESGADITGCDYVDARTTDVLDQDIVGLHGECDFQLANLRHAVHEFFLRYRGGGAHGNKGGLLTGGTGG